MDDRRFDLLTRRLVVGGAAGSLAALLGRSGARARRTSKRKRCREKKRDFCVNRCCPRGQNCTNQFCVDACPSPFQCPPRGPALTECGPGGNCFCGKTKNGKAACVDVPFPTNCNTLQDCGDGTPCPAGEVCFTCSCNAGTTPNFHCAPPCPSV